jgi:hypothetical protein
MPTAVFTRHKLNMAALTAPPVRKGPPPELLAAIGMDRADYTIPTPREAPDLWLYFWVGDIPLPLANGGEGLVIPTKSKVAKKGKVGAAKPRISGIGGEAHELKATIAFSADEWPAILAASKTLVEGSGPYRTAHPMCISTRFAGGMITGWDNAPHWKGGIGTWVLHMIQVDIPAQIGAGIGTGLPPAQVKAIENELAVIEKEKADIIGAAGYGSDKAISDAMAKLIARQQALEAKLRGGKVPGGEVVTPTAATGSARAGDVVPGTGGVAGAAARDDAAARRAEAQDEAAVGTEP